ncbi:MAG: sigma-70 family RNA polymerase sigma factor [Verrucomicrobiaceae bacterium]|nr:MAG: sigma-70 family RNA polymerase sigma factor [Verrucomicrobiaceae bacterium]
MRESEQTDAELLADWLHLRREAAFRLLVKRYAGLVHSAAKRTSGDEGVASEASQLVFILLARKAGSLASRTSLAGWLHLTAVMQAKNLMRRNRRETRKRQNLSAAMQPEPQPASHDAWKEMQPVLDDALAALSEKDREALLLRFYRSLSIREIAHMLGIAPDAAQKRVDRATERLRGKLSRRGCHAGASLAAAMIAGFATDAQAAAPSVPLLTSQALAGGTATATSTLKSSLTTLLAMKATAFVPPAIVLVIAGAWIGSQRETIHALDRQSLLLETAIAYRGLTASAEGHDSTVSLLASSETAKGEDLLDWNDIANRIRDSSFSDMDQMKFDLHMKSLTQEEMLAALDEIARLQIPEKLQNDLENMVLYPFSKRFPEYIVRHLTGRELDGSSEFELQGAFEAWAKRDSIGAGAWLDEQVSAGTFNPKTLDGKNWIWIKYEAGLFRSLLLQEGDALETRLGRFPADLRKDILHALGTAWKPSGAFEPGEEEAFSKLVRRNLSTEEQAELFAIRADQVESGGFPAVDKFLKAIEATQDERVRCVRAVAASNISGISVNRSVRHEDVAALRDWC